MKNHETEKIFCHLLKVRFLSSHEIMKQGTICLVGELEEEQRGIILAKQAGWVNLLSRDSNDR